MPDPCSADEVVWYVRPLAAPRVLRHCTACATMRAYAPCDLFRVNAQQRRLDVWLLYRCDVCEHTWQRSILRRVSRDALAPPLLERFLRNDPATAWQMACVPEPGLQLVPSDAVLVERPPLDGRPLRLRLTVPWPCGVRLDRLLATELGCSREALVRQVRDGEIAVDPGGRRALARPPSDGTRIVLAPGHGSVRRRECAATCPTRCAVLGSGTRRLRDRRDRVRDAAAFHLADGVDCRCSSRRLASTDS